MIWNSAADFFAMGGYALYVWSSFGMCALLFLAEPLLARHRYKQIVQRLRREALAEKLDEENK